MHDKDKFNTVNKKIEVDLNDASIFVPSRGVKKITGWSQSTLNRKVKKGLFPAPVYTGENYRRWLKIDVEQWKKSLQPIQVPEETADAANRSNKGK